MHLQAYMHTDTRAHVQAHSNVRSLLHPLQKGKQSKTKGHETKTRLNRDTYTCQAALQT